MSRKSRERYKDREKAAEPAGARPRMTVEELKRRRYRRLLYVALFGISIPILEVVAYQFRAITITIDNQTDQPVRKIEVIYDGGKFDAPEIKPGERFTRVIRPDFRFQSDQFATYAFAIHLSTDRQILRQSGGRAGALDFSAHEIYTIQAIPPKGELQLQHTTKPGFPLSLIRDLMDRLGIG